MQTTIDVEYEGKKYSVDIEILGLTHFEGWPVIQDWIIKDITCDGKDLSQEEDIELGLDVWFEEAVEHKLYELLPDLLAAEEDVRTDD